MASSIEHDRHNQHAIEAAVCQFRNEMSERLKESEFFTASLTVTVQNGVVSLSKIGAEKTQLFSSRR